MDSEGLLCDGEFVERRVQVYNRLTLRLLAGLVILLAASVAFPQAAPSDDPLKGPAKTYQKYEIRPGITLGVQYYSDGRACHADITPLHGPTYPPDETPQTISMNTINSIPDEILPAKTYGKRVGFLTSYMSCASVASLRANGATIKITEFPPPLVEVEEVVIDFDRPICHSEIHQNN